MTLAHDGFAGWTLDETDFLPTTAPWRLWTQQIELQAANRPLQRGTAGTGYAGGLTAHRSPPRSGPFQSSASQAAGRATSSLSAIIRRASIPPEAARDAVQAPQLTFAANAGSLAASLSM